MTIRITLELREVKLGDGRRVLTTLHQDAKFFKRFANYQELKKWHEENNPLGYAEHLIPFPNAENPNNWGMHKRLEARFGSGIKIEEVNDLSVLGPKGKRWGAPKPVAY